MKKIALIVGVSDYTQALEPLPNAVNDVRAMAEILQDPELGGFDVVTPLENPDRAKLETAIENAFVAAENKDDLILFYFSGHGVKDDTGTLYFANRDTAKRANGELRVSSATSSGYVRNFMDGCRSRRQVVILDCCFSGAFADNLRARDASGAVDVRRLLGGEGRAILTSSTATQYSFEQKDQALSIYTRYLVEGISTGAADDNSDGVITVQELHEYARRKVQEEAPQMKPQIEAEKEGFTITLTKAPQGDPLLEYRKEVERQVWDGEIPPLGRGLLDALRMQYGDMISDADAADIEEEVLAPHRKFQANLTHYDNVYRKTQSIGMREREELNRLRDLLGLREEDVEPIYRRYQRTGLALVMKMAAGAFVAIAIGLAVWQFWPPTSGSIPVQIAGQTFRDKLKNGGEGPLMVQVPAGKFKMGDIQSAGGSDEKPVHAVTLDSFAIGVYEVTFDDYDRFAVATGIGKPNDAGWGRGKRPVINVSWENAQAYVKWLSAQTGERYRLPSEAQWEYAARAGTETQYWWGNEIGRNRVNCDGCGSQWDDKQTAPVGSFKPNSFGLYDTAGNVWEWVEDCWHSNYNGAPTDGSAWTRNCSDDDHVLRGGSWYNDAWSGRAAYRVIVTPGVRVNYVGFRVSRW